MSRWPLQPSRQTVRSPLQRWISASSSSRRRLRLLPLRRPGLPAAMWRPLPVRLAVQPCPAAPPRPRPVALQAAHPPAQTMAKALVPSSRCLLGQRRVCVQCLQPYLLHTPSAVVKLFFVSAASLDKGDGEGGCLRWQRRPRDRARASRNSWQQQQQASGVTVIVPVRRAALCPLARYVRAEDGRGGCSRRSVLGPRLASRSALLRQCTTPAAERRWSTVCVIVWLCFA